ncbi:MAG: hypothetical protein A2Z49_13080, partial [Chloroflexi bacterium RBG_19FT_COMBO_56_12]
MFRRIFIFLFLAASILGLVACSGSSKISVTTTESKFDPLTWTVKAGKPVTITITNNGALDHEWVLIKQGQDVTVPFDADDEDKVFWEIEAGPGETKTETFTAPSEAGTYKVVCGTP